MATIFMRAYIPGELEQTLLQHLRDFDVAHPGCHFEIMIDDSGVSMEEAINRLRVDPELKFIQIFKRK
jgi:hypothetical protein